MRDLKARLSEVIDRAAAGETIVVTSRGKAKAAIGPVPAETRIQQGIREGWIRPGSGEPPEIPRKRYKGRMTVEEALLEDRGE